MLTISDGKPKTISFGSYPEVPWAKASQKRDYAKSKFCDGLTLMDEQSRPAAMMVFAVAFKAYRNNAMGKMEMLFPTLSAESW